MKHKRAQQRAVPERIEEMPQTTEPKTIELNRADTVVAPPPVVEPSPGEKAPPRWIANMLNHRRLLKEMIRAEESILRQYGVNIPE